MLQELQGRNGTGEFARRSMKNLEYILDAAESSAEVHPVTQTVGALLGVIVFPWENGALNAVKNKRIAVANSEGWPSWVMSGKVAESHRVKTIGDLIELLRNSIAHGHVSFDSDSKQLSDVTVIFENHPRGDPEANWRGEIRADQLALFCKKFSNFVADFVA
ncbi:MAG: hypothetical protein H8E47_11590 [Anaerolineales bacterium]|nr:hypothetical protein [Anaerolineales bacterium]